METRPSNEILERNSRIVHDLIQRQKIIENLAHQQHSNRRQALVDSLVHRQHLAELDHQLKRLHSADLGHVLETLPLDDRLRIWRLLMDKRGPEILLEVSDAVRQSLLGSMTETELRSLLAQMDSDDLLDIADDLPESLLGERLTQLSGEEKQRVQEALTYPEDTVGSLMSIEMVQLQSSLTLEQAAQYLREQDILPENIDKLFVVNHRHHLVGILSLQNLVLSDPHKRLEEVMAKDVVSFTPDDNAEQAAMAFERYDLVSAPVLNRRGQLLGRLTVDEVMDYLREKSNEDVLNMAGINTEEDLFSSIWSSARNRLTWLIVNLFTTFIAAHVIGFYEDTISHLVILAALMPIVASVGGNTGNQTTALIIRALSQGQVRLDKTAYMYRKEIGVSAVNGIILGSMVALFTVLFYHNLELAGVIAAAMLITLILAAILGLTIPIFLHRWGRDPALGSSVRPSVSAKAWSQRGTGYWQRTE